MDNLDKLAT